MSDWKVSVCEPVPESDLRKVGQVGQAQGYLEVNRPGVRAEELGLRKRWRRLGLLSVRHLFFCALYWANWCKAGKP